MNIDINKKYATRDGREVVIFEISDKVYCKIREHGEWYATSRHLNGRLLSAEGSAECRADLQPVKTWRAWKEGEEPRWLMVCWKNDLTAGVRAIRCGAGGYSREELFRLADWLHEDGTATPCGVLES